MVYSNYTNSSSLVDVEVGRNCELS